MWGVGKRQAKWGGWGWGNGVVTTNNTETNTRVNAHSHRRSSGLFSFEYLINRIIISPTPPLMPTSSLITNNTIQQYCRLIHCSRSVLLINKCSSSHPELGTGRRGGRTHQPTNDLGSNSTNEHTNQLNTWSQHLEPNKPGGRGGGNTGALGERTCRRQQQAAMVAGG